MPAERLIIVVEGKSDVLIIRALLSAELRSWMRFFAGQGRESLITLARNLLVHEGGPVLLVMDVATAELPSRDEMVAEAMRALSTVGAPGMFQVFTFVPEIESVFFEAPDALQRALGTSLPADVLEECRVKPKAVLQRLLAGAHIPNTEALIRKLDEEAIASLSRGKQAMALRETLRAFCRPEASAMR
jgi:hypothetical protein